MPQHRSTELNCSALNQGFHFTTVGHHYFTKQSWNPAIFNAWECLSVPSATINFVMWRSDPSFTETAEHSPLHWYPSTALRQQLPITVPYSLLYPAINGNIWQVSLPCSVSWTSNIYKISQTVFLSTVVQKVQCPPFHVLQPRPVLVFISQHRARKE